MTQDELLQDIEKRLSLLEQELRQIREDIARVEKKRPTAQEEEEALDRELAAAAERLAHYYAPGGELNVWESIEGDDFLDYETK